MFALIIFTSKNKINTLLMWVVSFTASHTHELLSLSLYGSKYRGGDIVKEKPVTKNKEKYSYSPEF